MGFAFGDSDSQTLEIFLVFRWFPLIHDQEAKTIKGYCMTSVMQKTVGHEDPGYPSWLSMLHSTVDGSEIPFPTTERMYKTRRK